MNCFIALSERILLRVAREYLRHTLWNCRVRVTTVDRANVVLIDNVDLRAARKHRKVHIIKDDRLVTVVELLQIIHVRNPQRRLRRVQLCPCRLSAS